MIDAPSVAAGLLAAALALARRMVEDDQADGLTPGLVEQLAQQAPQLTFRRITLPAGSPTKLTESNPSTRRRTVIQNTGGVQMQVAGKKEDLPGGIELEPGAVLIDEPPHPHGGEWWGYAATNSEALLGEQQ